MLSMVSDDVLDVLKTHPFYKRLPANLKTEPSQILTFNLSAQLRLLRRRGGVCDNISCSQLNSQSKAVTEEEQQGNNGKPYH